MFWGGEGVRGDVGRGVGGVEKCWRKVYDTKRAQWGQHELEKGRGWEVEVGGLGLRG